MGYEKDVHYPVVLRVHVFEKIRAIDMTLAEFETLLGTGEVIEEAVTEDGELKELVLLLGWIRPLHVVVIVADRHEEERIITVYEPDPDGWSDDYRRRR